MKRQKKTTKLLDSQEMLQEALEDYLNNIETPLTTSGNNILIITDNNENIIVELHKKLKEALVCGQGEAAWYLAQFYYNGWLVKKDYAIGDFILVIGKNLDSVKCTNTSYKNDKPPLDTYKKLALVCANSIKNTKDIYKQGINDIMKINAEFAFNKHLENTELQYIFNIHEKFFSSISTVSAPLPPLNKYNNYHDTESRKTQSEIKHPFSNDASPNINRKIVLKEQPQNEIERHHSFNPTISSEIHNEQTPIIGHDKHDGSGCACLIT